jgi:hypothetical protein
VLSPSREVLDLIATSPVAAEATAVALQNGSVLSAASFSELTASHPWSSRRPDDVLLELQRIPALAHVLSELNPRRQRELLSGIGQAMEPVLISMEQRLLRVSVESFSRFSGVVESEFVFFCKALSDIAPFDRGSWEQAQNVLNSDQCKNLRELLRGLVSSKGSHRNFARQSAPIKLRKVGFVLLQLGKLRSERFSGFAIKMTTYLHFRGVPDDVVSYHCSLVLLWIPTRDGMLWKIGETKMPSSHCSLCCRIERVSLLLLVIT